MTITYPAGPVVPQGWYHIIQGDVPMMRLTAYDGSVEIYMLGGLSMPDRYAAPEHVQVTRDGLKGLIPPWKHITQKGATEDGVHHIDALLDPVEVQLILDCCGRNKKHTRRVYRHLIDSLDAIKQSKLDFFDHEAGYWWADVRWFQGAPPDPVTISRNKQRVTLRLQADIGCWKSFDHADSFGFSHEAMTDTFSVDHRPTQDLGPVPQWYTGPGGGFCTSYNDQMRWWDDPEHGFGTQWRRVINGPWPGFETDTDNQVISQVHGGFQEWSIPDSGRNILGGRMNRNPDGSWAGDGVFVEYGGGYLRLYYTTNFVDTTLRSWPLAIPIGPLPDEKFTLVCGYDGDPRTFKVLRNGLEILSVKERGTGSPLGATHRGVGDGMFAGGAVISQATPSSIRKLSAGDNSEVAQSGFLKRINIGDQKMYDDYFLTGPGTFKIYDGPGSDEFVEFGPLLPNQRVMLRTDPRVNTTLVQDLTSVPPSPQELDLFQEAVEKFMSFAGMNNTAFEAQIESLFGIRPPQGNLYKYLKGRFSNNAAIPPKSPGAPAQPYYVKVSIEGGNADSQIIASGTPLRRYPL